MPYFVIYLKLYIITITGKIIWSTEFSGGAATEKANICII